MWRGLRHCGWTALILGALGCQHSKTAVNTKQAPDPLLISKKPVEGRAATYEASAARDPQPPAPPRDASADKSSATKPLRPTGYRPSDDPGVSIGKPRWLPNGQ